MAGDGRARTASDTDAARLLALAAHAQTLASGGRLLRAVQLAAPLFHIGRDDDGDRLDSARYEAASARPGTPPAPASGLTTLAKAVIMGKYFLAWLLGVPAIVLIILYFIF